MLGLKFFFWLSGWEGWVRQTSQLEVMTTNGLTVKSSTEQMIFFFLVRHLLLNRQMHQLATNDNENDLYKFHYKLKSITNIE